jgi:pSer/pThr/pTyr-binding forkhead associated (FHA) protein
MAACLVALDDHASLLLHKPIVLIGRHPECDIQLESRKISRRHCCIAQVNDYLVVRDLGSTNGIRINGHPVVEGRLCSGDVLVIGNLRYQVHHDPTEEDSAPGGPRPVGEEPAKESSAVTNSARPASATSPSKTAAVHPGSGPGPADTAAIPPSEWPDLLDLNDPLIQGRPEQGP